MTKLVIATRRSRLALWQAEHVKERLQALGKERPQALGRGLEVELLALSTRGDELVEVSLAKVGGKGLFVKELENALAAGRADVAVHSMKDVPAQLPEGFALAAILARDDPRDALVSLDYSDLSSLPAGAIVGTSSLRRQAQIAERHPGLEIRSLRGNVETRVAKLDRGEYAAIVLAAAGLKRLGLEARIRSYLPVEDCLPAAGQAALGVECLATRADLLQLLAPLEDRASSGCVRAERAVNRALGGSCTIPLGAFAEQKGARLRLRAVVASPDGKKAVRAELEGEASEPEALGARVAGLLRERGADQILAALVP